MWDSRWQSGGVGGIAEPGEWSGYHRGLTEQVDLISHLSTHVWTSQGISFSSTFSTKIITVTVLLYCIVGSECFGT